MTFQEWQLQNYGYECITTFWDDFSLADVFGKQAVKQTYDMAFKECESNYKYLTELVIVLNHKCRALYHAGNKELSQLYHDLYYKAHHYACEHLKGEEFDYYFNIVD